MGCECGSGPARWEGDGIGRRAAIGACAAWAAGLLLTPASKAFADAAWWSESDYHGGCANGWNRWLTTSTSNNGKNLAKGSRAYMKTPWGVWAAWLQYNSAWTRRVPQLLGAGFKTTLECDWMSTLFYEVKVYCLVSAFSSVNKGMRKLGWQKNGADDSRYDIYFGADGGGSSCIASASYDINTNSDSPKTVHWAQAGDSDRDDWYTDYENWSGSPITTLFIRRGTSPRSLWFGTCTRYWDWFCNYCGSGTYHGSSSGGGVTFHADGLTAKAPAKTITPGLEWCGRFVRFMSAASDGSGQYLYLGDNKNAISNGQNCGMWSGAHEWNRMWVLSPVTTGTTSAGSWTNSNPWKGSLKMKNVFNIKRSGGYLNAYGGGPTSTSSVKAVGYDYDGSSACGNWVFSSGGNQYIATDCGGHLLNRAESSSANGKNVHFWGNGSDSADIADGNAKWKIQEVLYGLMSGKALTYTGLSNGVAKIGQKLTCADPRGVTNPNDSVRKYASYDVKWVALDTADAGAWLKDRVTVYSRCRTDWTGVMAAEMPCDNYAGTWGLGGLLNGVHLRIPYTTLSGSIQYRLRKTNGGWDDWRTGSKGDDGTGSDAWAGSKTDYSRANDQLQCKLTGDLAKKYDVYYRVCYTTGSVGGWVANGATAGGGGGKICCIAVRLIPKSVATGQTYTPTTAVAGKKLACWTRCYVGSVESGVGNPTRDIWLLSSVASTTIANVQAYIKVNYHADGQLMFTQVNVPVGNAFSPSADGIAACKRQGCDGVTGLYTDAACTKPWKSGTAAPSSDLNLYCRNKVTLRFALTDEAEAYFAKRSPFADEGLSSAWDWKNGYEKAYSGKQLYYGDTVSPNDLTDVPGELWCDHEGPRRLARCGAFASKSAKWNDAPKAAWKLSQTVTAHYGFELPAFDGYAAG